MTPRTPDATALVSALTARGETVAVAESLTGGLLVSALVDVPGASAVLRGGVVAYATDLKAALLGVDPDLLLRAGAVDPDVATAMALGVRERLTATYGLATTGVAGPDPQDGVAVGTVYVALAGPRGVRGAALVVSEDRAGVRSAAVRAALDLLASVLGVAPEGGGEHLG
ncbi:MAG TPA: CinA family protein [Candidatus Limnocylindria bacterium]|nr:CinA family protein [Candidatus Limnocylindria bacterium]